MILNTKQTIKINENINNMINDLFINDLSKNDYKHLFITFNNDDENVISLTDISDENIKEIIEIVKNKVFSSSNKLQGESIALFNKKFYFSKENIMHVHIIIYVSERALTVKSQNQIKEIINQV